MKKLIPCMLAGLIITGLFALCITSFLAPSANYIKDTLDPPEEPFYITVNPESQTLVVGSSAFLVARSNIDDVIYSWQYRVPNTVDWRSVITSSLIDGCYTFSLSTSGRMYFRCAISYGDRTIYSAPCLLSFVSSSEKFDTGIKSEFEELEKNSVFEDFDKIDDIQESEVIE